MYKLSFYVPASHLKAVKDAVFVAGAGSIGAYDRCCWQTVGQGQFRPLLDSQPFIGDLDVVQTVAEYKVEMVCADHLIEQVIAALRQAHPYEEPALDLVRLEPIPAPEN